MELTSIEQHGLPSDLWEFLLHLEIYNFILLTHHPLQQFAQPGNIPLALAKFIERSVFCFFMLNLKYLVKSPIGGDHT